MMTPNTFDGLWTRAVATHAHRPFLVFRDEEGEVTTWTYEAFDQAVARVARTLQEAGLERGSAIHVALRNSPAFVAIWLAVARLGAWMVPVDPQASSREIASQVRRTNARVGIYGESRASTYIQGVAGQSIVTISAVETADDLLTASQLAGAIEQPANKSHSKPAASERLALMFTSGTTSEPKGVELTQLNYVNCARSMASLVDLEPHHRWFVTLPLFHANAQFYCFAPAILVGASVALASSFSASQWLHQAAELEVTHASLFAAPLRMILARHPAHTPDLSLEHVWFAQNIGAAHLAEFAGLVGVTPRQLYGLTETLAIVTADLSSDHGHDTIGVAIPGREVVLLDPTSGEEVQAGEIGIITLRGTPGVDIFASYLDDSERTAAVISERHSGTWFSTGDLARELPDGTLRFVGRRDDVIKVAGENVSLSEVEAVLAQAPGVLEVAVVARTDSLRDYVPVAFAVPLDAGHPPATDDLAAWAAEQLSPASRPREWYLLDSLPQTSVGKVRRFKLTTLAEQRSKESYSASHVSSSARAKD